MYRIAGGDFERAGAASSGLKDMLKKVGVEPAALRRAMIAAYEAETNVVIHAHRGEMRVTLGDGVLDVEVVDEGPGIPDIELAMKEGYSTAPPPARELGFGAGMGLPNIKRNSDRFQIHSTVGQGTRLRFTICFAPQAAAGRREGSLRVVAGQCTGCLRCLSVCPTEALRIRGARLAARKAEPQVLEHLCIECGACIAACAAGALAPRGVEEAFEGLAGAPLVVPAAFLVQFGPRVSAAAALAALARLGFDTVAVTAGWEQALRDAVLALAREQGCRWPVLSPACPAVVSLVEMRFPSLIGHLALFVSPVEAALRSAAGRGAAVVAGCPAQCSVLGASRERPRALLAPRRLALAVARAAAEGGEVSHRGPGQAPPDRSEVGGLLRVTGLRRVMAVLEKAENGLLADVPALELWACDEACFGSPLLGEGPAVARWRWERCGGTAGVTSRERDVAAGAIPREKPFAARRGLRLDDDMARAIAKLAELDRLVRELPGRNCGLCGAPSCRALAEDIVLGRAERSACLLGGWRDGDVPPPRRGEEVPR
ncbi:MAG TPA: (Fe-S)-binding protein [Planctomycetota bacterium]|nr:(Fe-S)-binding protein [Planctomycetota bacterium]